MASNETKNFSKYLVLCVPNLASQCRFLKYLKITVYYKQECTAS